MVVGGAVADHLRQLDLSLFIEFVATACGGQQRGCQKSCHCAISNLSHSQRIAEAMETFVDDGDEECKGVKDALDGDIQQIRLLFRPDLFFRPGDFRTVRKIGLKHMTEAEGCTNLRSQQEIVFEIFRLNLLDLVVFHHIVDDSPQKCVVKIQGAFRDGEMNRMGIAPVVEHGIVVSRNLLGELVQIVDVVQNPRFAAHEHIVQHSFIGKVVDLAEEVGICDFQSVVDQVGRAVHNRMMVDVIVGSQKL